MLKKKSIIVEDLAYRYGTLMAVDHIDFDVAAGEILGVPGGLTGQARQQRSRCSQGNCTPMPEKPPCWAMT